ncbi:melanoma antigen recognized by T-cells 1 isoform X1 [Heterocephalus glaber]|uniref:Melanoma antigen recognized by T-cells 1 isoform X1 n=1 Tax=Heterocephalus glaber TaxID=10181 RepID=A0AAX6SHZ2_HETGA|nr:melanoma antigen recognized by T-cells 1 isoform X1 [Heterocephalus glaber]
MVIPGRGTAMLTSQPKNTGFVYPVEDDTSSLPPTERGRQREVACITSAHLQHDDPPWAAGIGILTVILGILLLIGCWYCRRQSGYRTLMDKNLHAGVQGTLCGRCSHEELGHQDTKLFFQEKNCEPLVPNAPPAYEKLSREQSPPPYSP